VEKREQVARAWGKLTEIILPVQRALLTSIHLSKEEKDYFMGYPLDVDNLKPSNDIRVGLPNILAFELKYVDFAKMRLKCAETPASV